MAQTPAAQPLGDVPFSTEVALDGHAHPSTDAALAALTARLAALEGKVTTLEALVKKK